LTLCLPGRSLVTNQFHFTSWVFENWIQCAVIPKNPIFVLSADHPSMVTNTFPGASYTKNVLMSVNVCSARVERWSLKADWMKKPVDTG
jgi:hypothetical protein